MTYFCCHERLQYFHKQYSFGRITNTDFFHPDKLCIFVFITSSFLSGESVKKTDLKVRQMVRSGAATQIGIIPLIRSEL